MMYFPKTNVMTMIVAIKMTLYLAVVYTDFSARSICFAPKFCPTKVAAALLSPQAGSIKNIIILNAV
ncbi:hypothetical protein D3C86_1367050 [compost metagenome]